MPERKGLPCQVKESEPYAVDNHIPLKSFKIYKHNHISVSKGIHWC